MSLFDLLSNLSSYFSTLNVNSGIALVTIALIVLYSYLSKSKRLPPGPIGLPFVGYLPFLGSQPHETFQRLANKYGQVFSLYLGSRLVIVLNNYDATKEAFVRFGDVFSGRPNMDMNITAPEKYSLGSEDGEIWKSHRRFALHVLKDLGVGKQSMETLIMDEIRHFLSELNKLNGEPTNFSKLLTASVSNNICILIFGKRFEYNDPRFINMREYIAKHMTTSSAVSTFIFFPWLKKLHGIQTLIKQETLIQLKKNFRELVKEQIQKRKNNYVDGQKDNYINAFIGEQMIRRHKDKNDVTFPDIALSDHTQSLMIAGTDTTSNSLMWIILCLILNPNVQEKIQKEIDEVIGKERPPCWIDRLRTPYTEATIYEVQRFATLVPTNVPHRTMEDCELFGYHIPKDAMVLSNIWAVHNDTHIWKDPHVFQPERFLTPKGELDKKEYLIPFSIGKRECLGISLAKMELYLYVTSMLQRFTFKSHDGTTPSMEPITGLTFAPKYFNIRAIPRNV